MKSKAVSWASGLIAMTFLFSPVTVAGGQIAGIPASNPFIQTERAAIKVAPELSVKAAENKTSFKFQLPRIFFNLPNNVAWSDFQTTPKLLIKMENSVWRALTAKYRAKKRMETLLLQGESQRRLSMRSQVAASKEKKKRRSRNLSMSKVRILKLDVKSYSFCG